MATFVNRSHYLVQVPRNPDLNRKFPHTELAAAHEYVKRLRTEGHPAARLEPGG